MKYKSDNVFVLINAFLLFLYVSKYVQIFPEWQMYFNTKKSIAVLPLCLYLNTGLGVHVIAMCYCCCIIRFNLKKKKKRNISSFVHITVWYSSKIHVLNKCHTLYIFSHHQMFFGLLDLLICRGLNSLSLFCVHLVFLLLTYILNVLHSTCKILEMNLLFSNACTLV